MYSAVFNLLKSKPSLQAQKFPEKSGLGKSVAVMNGEDGWKRVRDLMSPTFSSGKLKQVFILSLGICIWQNGMEL